MYGENDVVVIHFRVSIFTKMMVIILVNIFLMLFANVVYEYTTLGRRMTVLENTVNTTLDNSIQAAISPEEFFTAEYVSGVLSHTVGSQGYTIPVYLSSSDTVSEGSSTKSGNWYNVNIYDAAMQYEKDGNIRLSGAANIVFSNLKKEARTSTMNLKSVGSSLRDSSQYRVFQWLYGSDKVSTKGVDCSYNHSNLSWANRSYQVKQNYSELCSSSLFTAGAKANDKNRAANAEFKQYYETVGKKDRGYSILQEKSGDTYKLEPHSYPKLTQMGLNLDSQYNSVNSKTVLPTMNNVVKIGKGLRQTDNNTGKVISNNYDKRQIENSVYFLTPASLGVTYIPRKVLEPTFKYMLSAAVRLNRVNASLNDTITVAKIKQAYSDAQGFVNYRDSNNRIRKSNVFTKPTLSTANEVKPTSVSGEDEKYFVNDGDIAYDLKNIQFRVDYKYVDLYDGKHNLLTTDLFGSMTAGNQANGVYKNYSSTGSLDILKKTVEKLKERDNGYQYWKGQGVADSDNEGGGRIVAKVTVRVPVVIPYKSSILQWSRYLQSELYGEKVQHFGIRLYDHDSKSAIKDRNNKMKEDATTGAANYNYTTDGKFLATKSDRLIYQYSKYYVASR